MDLLCKTFQLGVVLKLVFSPEFEYFIANVSPSCYLFLVMALHSLSFDQNISVLALGYTIGVRAVITQSV